ncbi:MAG: septation protein SpoVG [Spirochaetia bacterium]|nr:septation protein SpoVG [Spirochaetia bacterium]
MKITDVRVRKITSEGKLRAYATITFDDQFVIHNLKVIDGKSGLFVAMPSRKTKSGEFKDVAHPISSEFRAIMQEAILQAYEIADEPTDTQEWEE